MGGICTRAAPDSPRNKALNGPGAQRQSSGVLLTTSGSCCISGFAGATLGNRKHQVHQQQSAFVCVCICISHTHTHTHTHTSHTHTSHTQDRFMIVPALLNGVLYCGVFDGHAEEGGIVAERAAQTLCHELASALQWLVHVCFISII